MANRDVYQLDSIVNVYRKATELLGPEKTVLEQFAGNWKNWRVLDIGIGTGRTTHHFAPLCREYVGVDYAESMVEASKKDYGHFGTQVRIQTGDVRSMPEFEDGYFDFVMFSYNGLDSISHDERLQALREMKRVGRKGGYLFFSSHNIQYIPSMYRIRHNNNPLYLAYRFYRLGRLLYHNGLPGKYKNLDYTVIRDDVHQFRMNHYYAKPRVVVDQLNSLGFSNVRVLPAKTSGELDLQRLDAATEYPWLHYLCEI